MKKLILFLPLALLCLWSCTPNEKILVEKEVTFAIASPAQSGNIGGRIAATPEPKSVLVTIKASDGTIVADRKELILYKFGENFLSLPLTLKTSGASKYLLTEFMVMSADNKITYATPKEGSKLAHLVGDPLDIEFTVVKDIMTTVTPEVLALDENNNPADYGYGQFGFTLVKTISAVFSAFIKGVNNFELTNAHIKIEGLKDSISKDTTALWVYETDLEAKANTIGLKEALLYKITVTRQGYEVWSKTIALEQGAKIEILFERTNNRVDVYAAGYVGKNATYWKNGLPVTLAKTESFSYATRIYVFDSDVYVTGRTLELPMYWKNGDKKFLPIPSDGIQGETHDIIVTENDLHIVGDYLTSNHVQPTYWRNGVRTDLQVPSPFTNGHADKITLSGSDVYIIGYVRTWNTTLLTAALWKNGVYIPLPIPSDYLVSDAKGVKVSDGHVYVSGYITTSTSPTVFYSSIRAVYWKDGEMQFVEQIKPSSASALDVAGNDIYIPYNVNSDNGSIPQAKYWKNGQQVFVDEGVTVITNDLSVSNGDVFIAGTYKQNSTDRAIACYWINGQRVLLQSEKESQAVSCFVVRVD